MVPTVTVVGIGGFVCPLLIETVVAIKRENNKDLITLFIKDLTT
jgi:hypothetical protein